MQKYFLFLLVYLLSNTLPAQLRPEFNWGHITGGSSSVLLNSIIDSEQNVYTVGIIHEGNVEFGENTPNSTVLTVERPTYFLAKYSNNGELIWVRTFAEGYALFSDFSDLKLDLDGNLVIASMIADISGSFSLQAQGFIAKFKPDGTQIWFKKTDLVDKQSSCRFTALSINSKNEIYVAGSLKGKNDLNLSPQDTTYIEEAPLAVMSSDGSAFIAKYSAAGEYIVCNVIRGKEFGVNLQTVDLQCDANDNLYMAGTFFGSADFDFSADSTILKADDSLNYGETDLYFASYTDGGALRWAYRTGSPYSSRLYDLLLVDNKVYLGGGTSGLVDFDPSTAVDTSGGMFTSGFITCFDTLGNYQWHRKTDPVIKEVSNGAFFTSLSTDSKNNLVCIGMFAGQIDFDPRVDSSHVINAMGINDAFIARYSADGDFNWVGGLGESGAEVASYSSVVDDNDRIFISGYKRGSIDFDPSDSVVSSGFKGTGSDIFLAKYSMPSCESIVLSNTKFPSDACIGLPNNVEVVNSETGYAYAIINEFGNRVSEYVNGKDLNNIELFFADTVTQSIAYYVQAYKVAYGACYKTIGDTALVVFSECSIVINEFNTNNPIGKSQDFVELYNPNTSSISLKDYTILAIDKMGNIYRTITLPDAIIAPNEYFLVCGKNSSIANCDYEISQIEDLFSNDGVGAIALFDGNKMKDVVAYGQYIQNYTEGKAATFDTITVSVGISRALSGFDTDNNATDFYQACITPGQENVDYDAIDVVLPGDIFVLYGGDTNLTVLSPIDTTMYTYLWTGPHFYSTEQSPLIANIQDSIAGLYNLQVANEFACTGSKSMNIWPVEFLQATISQEGEFLRANAGAKTYIWFNCDTQVILDTTSEGYFKPSENGNYGVIEVSSNGMYRDTSACININNVDITTIEEHDEILVLPNPTNGFCKILLGDFHENVLVQVGDATGKIVFKTNLQSTKEVSFNLVNYPKGLYYVSVSTNQTQRFFKLVKK